MSKLQEERQAESFYSNLLTMQGSTFHSALVFYTKVDRLAYNAVLCEPEETS